MGFRIQPPQLEVPEADPFANDKLGRKEPAVILTRIVRSFDGPCVVAIDAAWGNGKTTFLRMWARHLRNEGCPVVEFNAWETDFSDDPFLALSEELIEELDSYDNSVSVKIDELKSAAIGVLRHIARGLTQSAAATLAGSLAGEAVGDLIESITGDRLSEYSRTKTAMVDFRKTLRQVAISASGVEGKGRPLVVVIDELDRCRPTYAIALLETAKHLFSVDGVVFVLGINRAGLEHSVNALYGAKFDGVEYLRRFFDVDFRLPEADRRNFIDAQLIGMEIDNLFRPIQTGVISTGPAPSSQLLLDFFGSADISLRTVEQALRRLALVLAALPSDKASSILTATFTLILRTLEPDLYYRLAHGKATDQEVVEAMFGRMADDYRYRNVGHNLEYEIIAAASEPYLDRGEEWHEIDLPLLRRYRELAQNMQAGIGQDAETNHADTMIQWIRQQLPKRRSTPMFRYCHERLELLSKDLSD